MSEQKASRELDALIAEKVFGQPWRNWPYVVINTRRVEIETWLPIGESGDNPGGGTCAGQTPPPYSTSIALAWRVVEKLRQRFTRVEIHIVPDGICCMLAVGDDAHENYPVVVEANTAALAICRAALAALEATA